MEPLAKEKIREKVRETYGKIAETDTADSNRKSHCCTIGDAVPFDSGNSCGCGQKDFSPDQMSIYLGYSPEDMKSVPEGANLGLGCGNPVAIASLKTGETVVDLGSGGGFDCFLALKQVGNSGRVIGVDMTPEIITRARNNTVKIGTENVEFRLGEIEHLPMADNTADIIMSNCVINLSPDKQQVYHEMFRVLKPGGRLAISDIVATALLPKTVQNDLVLVAACIGGAETIDKIIAMLEHAGFQQIKITPKNQSRKMITTWMSGSDIADYVVSADIEAVKP